VSNEELDALLAQVRRSTRSQSRAMVKALNDYSTSAPETCILACDTRALGGKQRSTVAKSRLYHRGWRLAFLTAWNVGDHLTAIGDVASTASPRVFAHMTLARAALEGAARVHYLLDPQGTTAERVLRAAALLLASAEEELKAVDEFRGVNDQLHVAAQTAAQARHADVADLIKRAGISPRHSKTKRGPLLGVEAVGSMDSATLPVISTLLRQLIPDKPAAYRVSSGVVHSQPWVLDDEDAFHPPSRELRWPLDPVALAGSVDLGITASILVINDFAAVLGQDAQPQQREADRREQAVSRIAQTLRTD